MLTFDVLMNSTEVIEVFRSYAQPEVAQGMEAYMKNQFTFLGIKSPERKQISKEVMAEARKEKCYDQNFFRDLWEAEPRELQYVAQEYLYYTRKWWPTDILHDIHYALTHKSWWDTVDYLASTVTGYLMLQPTDEHKAALTCWVESEDMWLRRASIIYQLKYKEQTDTDFLTFAIEKNLGSREFFINKAIGWALRQYSKTDAEWVRNFIQSHTLEPLSQREASKYLS